MTPYELQKRLISFQPKDSITWKQDIIDSYDYRKLAKAQHENYYFQRRIWEYCVKSIILGVGLTILAMGGAASPVLALTTTSLFLNNLCFNVFTKVKHVEYSPKTAANTCPSPLVEQQRAKWFLDFQQAQIKEESRKKRLRIIKAGLVTTIGFTLFVFHIIQPGFLTLTLAFLALCLLLKDADQEPSLYLEKTRLTGSATHS